MSATQTPRQFSVDDVRIGAQDLTESKIEQIYAKVRPTYAVYRTDVRVSILYADNDAVAQSQRKRIAPLNGLRTEINGLINGWRTNPQLEPKARRYDARVAAALILALEDDCASALTALAEIKSESLGSVCPGLDTSI